MTELLERHGGPSDLHEYRAATLSTMATLTRHTCVVDCLLGGERPDVLQLRPADGSLFIGDAKAAETPGNAETYERLCRYSSAMTAWIRSGRSGVLALVVGRQDAYGWLRVLRDLCVAPAGGARVDGHLDPIDLDTVVVWQGFVSTGRD